MESIDERIEAFLRGNMSADEEAAFKQELKENPGLRNQAKTMISLIKGLHAKESQIESSVIKTAAQKSAAASKQTKNVLWWTCSIAAALVVIFGIYKVRRNNLFDETVSPYYKEYNMSNIPRGDIDSVTITHLYTLFSQIQENRNISNIIKELEPIYHSLDDDYTYHPWANDIAWNLALAYIKDDQIDKAITILDKLKQDNPDTPICSKADELIKKLSDL